MRIINYNYWDNRTFWMYIFVLLFSMFLSYRAERNIDRGTKHITVIGYFQVVTVLFVWGCILTCRNLSRGVDSIDYYTWFGALPEKIDSLWTFLGNTINEREPLYTAIHIIVRVLFADIKENNDVYVLFALNAVLWLIFIYKAAKNEQKHTVLWLFIPMCFVLFFFRSFSMLRQNIALAIILYAYTELSQGKRLNFLCWWLIAIGFHYSALIGIVPYLYYSKSNKFYIILFKLLLIIGIFAFIFIGDSLIDAIFSDVDSRYSKLGVNRVGFGVGHIFMRLPQLVFFGFIKAKPLIKQDPKNKFYVDLVYLDFIIAQCNYVNPLFSRFTLYTEMYLIFLVPALYKHYAKGRKDRKSLATYFILFIILYFIYKFYFYIHINPYYISPYITQFGRE